MAYEATVPVHRRLLWSAVTDPERLLGAVPNLVVEASTEQGVAARLRLRVGDRSITFRGIARLVELSPEQLRAVLEIEAVHGRSDGAVDGRVELRLLAAGGGTRIVVEPELVLSGHAPTIPAATLVEAGGKLIPRWFDQLATASPEPRPNAAVTLTVVPDTVTADTVTAGTVTAGTVTAGTVTAGTVVPDTGAEDAAAAAQPAPAPAPAPAPQDPSTQDPSTPPPVPEPHGPTLTLITGDAQDASPSQKAPLRLVPDEEQDTETEAHEEPDLWSRGRGRLPGPLWILAAAALGMFGLAAVLLRRLLRHR